VTDLQNPLVASPIKVDVWSDIACPWCYIGKRKLEAGIEAFAAQPGTPSVEIEYHSFELSPDTPVDFEGDEVEFLANHKGIPAEQARQMLTRVVGIAEDVGLHYDYDALQHANTVKAHELIHYAKARGLQLEAKERLLKAYFEEGRNVGRIDDLADLATEIGLDRDDVVRSLTAQEFLPAVRADQRQAIEYGIQGVPFFVIDGKYGVSGAQDAATFSEVFAQVAGERGDEAAVR
jgi:predicted DsbA family dithiol-disulfide isomerase